MTEYTRIAIIDKDKCQPKLCNYLCHRVCPPVRMGDDAIVIKKKWDPPEINEELCTGCGICPNKCPFNAIQIINIGVKNSKPLHQFGKNSFRLYSIPDIEKGYITGIIGRNGAGKTTALNILSKNLIANFGDYDNKVTFQKTLDYYKGKKIYTHFKELEENNKQIAYKIQQVEDIPKQFNKPIIELLKTITKDTQKIENIVKELNLEKIINKTPDTISGGELQKVAIAATLLKEADIYFIDEYTTFLDIKQRFKIAKILENTKKNKSLLVIEHDLAILDYLSDFVEVMFGKKGAYGVCSNKKTTKKGINEFILGFLKEENIRIRNYKLEFKNLKEEKNTYKEKLIEYPKLTKKLGDFVLESESGEINSSEIIGILGPNAIGKTTFIKMLAGKLKPDNTEINKEIKVAYKPQYISYDKEKTVRELFLEEDIDKEIFESEIKTPLEIEKLYDQEIGSLSGGELQKVSIAHTLSKQAELYLIDEPSAFLDIEQRLIIGNIIRRIISKRQKAAFIIDHDLLFIDYISDKILLFSGEESKKGYANKIDTIKNSFNKFLKEQDLTFRQDMQTKRPRANKKDSQKDLEQKKDNQYYFTI